MFPLSNEILYHVLSFLSEDDLKLLLEKLRSCMGDPTTNHSVRINHNTPIFEQENNFVTYEMNPRFPFGCLFNTAPQPGLVVLWVKKESQLDQCGVRRGFRLVRVNDTPIFNSDVGRFLTETLVLVLLQNKSGCKLTFLHQK